MSSFTKPLVLEFDFEGNKRKPFKLIDRFSYYTELIDGVEQIDVEAGYRTDFASIPRIFHRILPPTGRYGKAAVIHDWLCDVRPKLCSHIVAANVFDEAMAVLGVPWITRKVMVRAVKWFGPKFKAGD